jgi:MarR family 2-MHQ and catechol resistance regulon transcriptional repressor
MSKSPKSEATTGPKLWVVLARAHAAMANYLEHCIAGEGLGLTDFAVLELLLHKGPMAISVIGQRVLLANASMTAAIDRLEKQNYVIREYSATDRRAKIVALTPTGRRFITRLFTRHARDIESVTNALNQQERTQLRALLKKLGQHAAAKSSAR